MVKNHSNTTKSSSTTASLAHPVPVDVEDVHEAFAMVFGQHEGMSLKCQESDCDSLAILQYHLVGGLKSFQKYESTGIIFPKKACQKK